MAFVWRHERSLGATAIGGSYLLPGMKERLVSEGFGFDDSPPEVFQARLKHDVSKRTKVVREAKVKVQ